MAYFGRTVSPAWARVDKQSASKVSRIFMDNLLIVESLPAAHERWDGFAAEAPVSSQ